MPSDTGGGHQPQNRTCQIGVSGELGDPTMSDREHIMKGLLVGLSITVWLQGCCAMQRGEPPYPKDVTGWRDYKEGTTKLRGSFVL
jgi:hypothetical protein